jgi:hypothetical protein
MLPFFCFAHNGEFITAQWAWHVDGSAELTLTVDYESNLWIKNAADFQQAADTFLELHTSQQTTPLSASQASKHYAAAQHLDPHSPLGHTAEELAQNYQLGILHYQWKKPPAALTLKVPPACPQTFILWMVDEQQPQQEIRWNIMIGGDESPLITRAPSRQSGWLIAAWVIFGLGLILLTRYLLKKIQGRCGH